MRRLLPVLVLVQACAPPTSMMVEFTTNLPCPTERTAPYLGIAYGGDENDVETTFTEVFNGRQCDDQTGVLGTYAFRPLPNDREQTIFLRAALAPAGDVEAFCSPKESTFDARRCVFARRRVRFTPGATLRVPVLFHDSCLGKPCEVNETCVVGGRCVSKNLISPTCRPNETCVVELDAGVGGAAGGAAGGGSAAGGSAGGGAASGGSASGGSASGGSAAGGTAAGGSASGGSSSGGSASGGAASGGSASGGSASGGTAAGGSASGGSASGGSASGGSASGGSASGGSASGGSASGGSASGGSASGGSASGGSASGGSASGGSASGGSASGGTAAGGTAAGGTAAGGTAAGGSASGGSAAGGSSGGSAGGSAGGASDAGVAPDCVVYQGQFCEAPIAGCCLRSNIDAGLGTCTTSTCAPSGTSSGLLVGCVESADCPNQPRNCWVRNNTSVCLAQGAPTNNADRLTCSPSVACTSLQTPNCVVDRVFPFLRTCQCDPLVRTCLAGDVCVPSTGQCLPMGAPNYPGVECLLAPPGQAGVTCIDGTYCCQTTAPIPTCEPDPLICPGVTVGCRTSSDCDAGSWCSYDRLTTPITFPIVARCLNGIEAREACRPRLSSARNCEGGGLCTGIIDAGPVDFGFCQ